MNRDIYRLVRNEFGLWVPAPEHTRSNGKGGKAAKALLAAALSASLFSANTFADNIGLPNECATCGGAAAFVAYGLAKYQAEGNTGIVSQVGDKAILNWRDFNIAPGNQVIFQRVADLFNLKAIDGASFSTLNRIWDQNPTVIAGQIKTVANQQANLIFINQNGILFANGAQINVGQFTASALNITNNDFINNRFAPQPGSEVTTPVFRYGMDGVTDNVTGFIKVLEGAKITSDVGGRVMLIAPTVTNRGDIATPSGQTILAAGSAVYLQTSTLPSLRGLLVQVDNKNLVDGDGKNNGIEKLLNSDFSSYKLTKDKVIETSDITKDKSGVVRVNVTAKYLNDSIEVLKDATGVPLLDATGKPIPLHKAGDVVRAGDQVALGDNVRVFDEVKNDITVAATSNLVTRAVYREDSAEFLRRADGSPILDANGKTIPVYKKGDIVGAGSKVFAGDKITELRGAEDVYDKSGNATNASMSVNDLGGTLTATKGNITMVGMAVNQMGRATATSAYNFNGSIYLRAISDPASVTDAGIIEKRAGRVVLGNGSVTEVGIDTADTTKSNIAFTPSKVDVIGTDIQVKSNAKVIVPAGVVNFTAVEDPSTLRQFNPKSNNDPFVTGSQSPTTKSSVVFESGSLVDVSGLDAIESQKDNVLEIKLLGAELANSPANRQTLRNKIVYVDVNKGSPLIANLDEYKANIAKTLQQRSTNAGSVRVQSTGQSIVQPGATFDLSGGVTTYKDEVVNTTRLVGADGRVYDISEARPDTQFVGLANEFTMDEGFGQVGVFSRTDSIYNLGYVKGGDAGLALFNARSAYLNGNILASTTAGVNQLRSGQLPLSAALMLGFNKGSEFGLNQNVLIDGKIKSLLDDGTLSDEQKDNLHLSSTMFGQNKIGRLEINSNKNVTIDQSLVMADGGSVNINAAKVNVNADISTTKANVALNPDTTDKPVPLVADTNKNVTNADVQTKSGAINIKATNNLFNDAIALGANANKPEVVVANNVKLSSTGFWINERANLEAANNLARLLDGGSISLTASYYDTRSNNLVDSKVALGDGSALDVRGGAYRSIDGKLTYGKGGDVSLFGTEIASSDALQNHFKGESFGAAGKLSVTSDRVLIGAKSPNALSIDAGFFNQGFASYALTGLSGLEVAENTKIKVQTNNLILDANAAVTANNSNVDAVGTKVLLDEALRTAADVSLSATTRNKSVGDDLNSQFSDLKMAKGSEIVTDVGGEVTLKATNSVDIDGVIKAPAGKITVTLDNEHNINAQKSNTQRIHLGENAVLAAVGAAKVIKDRFGLNQGTVLAGGTVTLDAKDGYVDTEKTALIDVSGAAPVDINILNVNGGQGQAFASDAGTVKIKGLNGLYLDNQFNASAGSSNNNGGVINFELGQADNAVVGQGKLMHVGQYGSLSPAGNAFRSNAQLDQGYVDPTKLQSAGFETINLTSFDTIQLEQRGDFGLTQPLYSVQLNTSNIVSDGSGDTTINAKLVALGNNNLNRQTAANAPTSGNTKLNVNAEYIALNGNASYSGFSDVNLNSTGEVRLIGVQPVNDINGTGRLNTRANVNILANLVDPSSLTTFEINTNGVGDVRFSFAPRTSNILAYSAQGKLIVNAKNIVQGGRIVAPFGDVSLKAANNLTLESGSLTSVAAAPGQIIPFGYTLNGKDWFFDKNGDGQANGNAGDNEVVKNLFAKKVTLDGSQVNVKSGATVDISATGDLQASQFTEGTTGTIDLLAQKGYYAILPGYNGTVAPTEVLRGDNSNQPLVGSSVYLGNGITPANYVLLPAKYALLPDAFAIKLIDGVQDVLPGNSYFKSDGVAVIGGFTSDQRFSLADINSARWTGFELLERFQVLDRAQYSITNASNFFAKNAESAKPQDAGLLQVKVKQALGFNGNLKSDSASGGVGAGLDISSEGKMAVLSASAAASARPDEVVLDIDQLNKLNIDSLLLGGTRTRTGSTTTVDVNAQQVRIDNVAGNGEAALQGREVMLAAKNDVVLQRDTTIKATGNQGNAGTYKISGDAAFVRAAATDAVLLHQDTKGLTGNISSDAGVKVLANQSVQLDATNNNLFSGKLSGDGVGLPKNLLFSANRMNVGTVPVGANGLNLTTELLDGLAGIENLTLRSYSSFDFYGNSNLGNSQIDATSGVRNYGVNNLTLEAADIRGLGASGNVANIQAKTLTFANLNAVKNGAAGTGTGQLNIQSDTLYLGTGTKAINGFANVNIVSGELLSNASSGELKLDANTQINTARMSGDSASSQKITSTANLNIASLATTLAARDAIGNSWTVSAKNLNVDTTIQANAGDIVLTATGGDLTLGQNAKLNASGKQYKFFDKVVPVDAGNITLKSDTGNITANTGAQISLDAVAGGNAGQLSMQAINGQVDVANATLSAKNVADGAKLGKSGSVAVDAKNITNFNQLNAQLNQGGFAEKRDFRLRAGDLNLTQQGTGTINAHELTIAVDAGALTVDNAINASGAKGGKVALFARDDVKLGNQANINASATAEGQKGGQVIVGTSAGQLDLQGGVINVADSQGRDSGEVLLRAPRTNTSVAVKPVNTDIQGASSVVLEGVRTYNNVSTVSAATINTILADNATFMNNKNSITNGLGAEVASLGSKFRLRGGAEVRSSGNMVVSQDVSLYQANRAGGEPGTLTLRANGDLTFNGSLSDGFVNATTTAAIDPNRQESWSYRLVAGADQSAANPLAVIQPTLDADGSKRGDFNLATGKLIRTGTGDIEIATAGNLNLANQTSVIYTAGRVADEVSGFQYVPTPARPGVGVPTTTANATPNNFTQNGGDVSIAVSGDVNGATTNQLYSSWLYRQGNTNANGNFDAANPQTAWWVQFSQFQQGIATLGGGDVNVNAGGNINNLSASAATNGRMGASTPSADKLVVLGGGDVNIVAGGDVVAGQYYAGKGKLDINANAGVVGREVVIKDTAGRETDRYFLYTTIALGDAQATIKAKEDINIQAVINPTMVQQSSIRTLGSIQANIFGDGIPNPATPGTLPDTKRSNFSTYTDKTAIGYESLNGSVVMHNNAQTLQKEYKSTTMSLTNSALDSLEIAPGGLKAYAYNGDVIVNGEMRLYPASLGAFELLAKQNVNINANISQSDAALNALSDARGNVIKDITTTATNASKLLNFRNNHASTPVHINDKESALIYALEGNVQGRADTNIAISLPKSAKVIAGQDYTNLGFTAQNLSKDDVTLIKAGRDIVFDTTRVQGFNGLSVGGEGLFELEAGRNLDLGASQGISSSGNTENSNLPAQGANINIAVGVSNGVDYEGAIERLLNAIKIAKAAGTKLDDNTLWQARWLAGNGEIADWLSAVEDLQAKVNTLQAKDLQATIEALNKNLLNTEKLNDTSLKVVEAISPKSNLTSELLSDAKASVKDVLDSVKALRQSTLVTESDLNDFKNNLSAVKASLAEAQKDVNKLFAKAQIVSADELLNAVGDVQSQGQRQVRERVRSMLYYALRETGRDYNNADSDFAGQYGRGYSAIELLFPNISEKNADGSSKFYAGDLNMPLSTIKTRSGGNIEFMVPGGRALVGYTNISDAALAAYDSSRKTVDTGIVAVSNGSIRGFALGDILVNQSRILTVAGGDVLLWSSEGNIDAGKGKRTATVVPPPLVYPDASGKIIVSLQGAATGSGIGALGDENTAGDVDLLAFKGSVDAGDAGVRARKINIASPTVLNAGNIVASVSARGTGVVDAGALNGVVTSASNAGDPNKAVSDAVKQAVKEPAEPFKKAPSPSFINVEVVSIGD